MATHQREQGVRDLAMNLRGGIYARVSLALEGSDDALRRLSLQATLLLKARAEEEAVAVLAALRRSTAPEDLALLEEWAEVQQRLTDAGRGTSLEERARLEGALQSIEDRLARRSAAMRERRALVDIDAIIPRIAARIAEDCALVELVSFRPFEARARTAQDRWGTPRYAAFVLHHDGTLAIVDLGEAAPIDNLAHNLTSVVSSPQRPPNAVAAAGRALDPRRKAGSCLI